MSGLGLNDDNVIDGKWRYVDSDDGVDMEEGLRFEDLLGFLKSKKAEEDEDEDEDEDGKKKGKKKEHMNRITMIWRGINWLIVWRIVCTFITFLFEKTPPFTVLPYVAPWIPWIGAAKMIFFFIALNIAFNASDETDKDKFRLRAAVLLSAIPTIFLMFVGEMGLLNLFIAGCISFSAYREKIYTDAKVRRTPPKKHKKGFTRDKYGNVTEIEDYDV